KGDRVRGKYSHKPGVIVGPDSGDACEVITDDGVQRSWLTQDIEFDDPAPLRFEDVRDGDTITVEGDEYKITGRAVTGYRLVSVAQGLLVALYNAEGDEWLDQNALPVRLTAHTPAEPEWHRAKVIMGCYTEAGTPDEPEYWLLGWDGLFYSVSGAAEDYE